MNSNSNHHKRYSKHFLRSRRRQYVNQACNECKRRKIRCDGANPCGKCLRASAQCIYPDKRHYYKERKPGTAAAVMPNRQPGDRPVNTTLESPNSSIEIDTHGQAQPELEPQTRLRGGSQTVKSPGLSTLDSPEFCGPSSSEFTLNVVSGNLKAMGMPSAILDKSSSEAGPSSSMSSQLAQYGPFMKLLIMDPLWDTRREDAIELIDQWYDGSGALYPVVSREKMLETANDVFGAIENAQTEGVKVNRGSLVEALFTDETNKLKIILAIGRTVETGGRNDKAQRLFQSTTEAVEGLLWNSNTIDGIQLLVLAALYYYHLDEEARTGRIVGFAARLCLEMGLHRRVTLEKTFSNLSQRSAALRTFWCVYMLERRTSLGQGVPFSIMDSCVDPSLFTLNDFGPTVSALLAWTKLAGRTWQVLNSQGEKETEISMEELDQLDYQIRQWYDQLPEDLRLNHAKLQQGEGSLETSYLQAVFFLRKGHLRNLIYRPVLQSAARIAQHERYAQVAMGVTKESLQTLSDLNENTVFVRTYPLFFKHLLLTAFGNLLLAIVNTSSTFADNLRDEFNFALDLIKLLGTRSGPLMRLWKRLRGLRTLQAKLFDPATPEVFSENTLSYPDYSSGPLLFDELFPAWPSSLELSGGTEPQGYLAGEPLVREHLNTLFDFPVGSSSSFNSPFFNWG